MDPFDAYQDIALEKPLGCMSSHTMSHLIHIIANSHFVRKPEYNRESYSSIKWSCLLCERSLMNSFDGY